MTFSRNTKNLRTPYSNVNQHGQAYKPSDIDYTIVLMTSFDEKFKVLFDHLWLYPSLYLAYHITTFIMSRFINMKSSRAMFSTFALFLTLMVVAECSKLQENHDIVNQFTEAFQRLEEKFAATEAKRDKEMKQENKEVITDLSEAMHRLEAKFAETEVKKDEEMKQMKKENAEPNDKVQRQVADIDLLNAEFDEFTEKQGKH